MNFFRTCTLYSCIIVFFALLFAGCGKKGPGAEARIKALEEQGVPDSVLSSVKVYLYNVTTLGKTGQMGKVRKYKDSLKAGIAAAEAWYEKAMQENKIFIDSLRPTLDKRKTELTGLPLKDYDSMLAVADSFVALNWLVQARTEFEKCDEAMGVFLKNQERAEQIRPKLYGTWTDVHVVRPASEDGGNYKATEKKVFTFKKDGSFKAIESMNGQTTPYMKENWEFQSWGTYDLMGDSIYLFVTREKCAKQIFTQLNVKTNKWKRNVKPTYDSTITNNAKDKFITYDDLKLAFKRRR